MFRWLRSAPPHPDPDGSDLTDDSTGQPDEQLATGPAVVAPDLAALPIVGITRRRVAAAVGVLLAVWVVVVFARQVGEAQAATAEADRIAAANVERQAEVASLERELEVIARQRYVAQQARAYGLGSPREVPFALDPHAPALPPDAPGSAGSRVGSELTGVTPLERWLTVLFGPSH